MLRRSPMKRGSGFKRPAYEAPPPAPPRPATRRGVYQGETSGPAAKAPADRLQALRDLAQGEACLLQLPGCCCRPETTVLAHSNALADGKGMGYKAADSRGVFAGYACHAELDQGGRYTAEEKAEFWDAAQARMTARLQELATSAAVRPWKVQAARQALQLRGAA